MCSQVLSKADVFQIETSQTGDSEDSDTDEIDSEEDAEEKFSKKNDHVFSKLSSAELLIYLGSHNLPLEPFLEISFPPPDLV